MEWLMTIARNSAAARMHGTRRDNRKQEISADQADSAISVASGQQKLARTSLEAIPPAQRELLEWAYYGGLVAAKWHHKSGNRSVQSKRFSDSD